MHACSVPSLMSDSVAPWTVAHQAPLSLGFSRQKYWSELPFPSPGDLPDPGIELTSLKSPMLACRFFTTDTTWEAHTMYRCIIYVNVLWHLVWCLPSSRTRVMKAHWYCMCNICSFVSHHYVVGVCVVISKIVFQVAFV